MANDILKITGKIISVLPKKTGVCKKGEWTSQEYILRTEDAYPRKICVEVYGLENINKFDIKKGDWVEMGINIYSREFSKKWYTTVRAWCVEKLPNPYTGQTEENNYKPAPTSKPKSTTSKKTSFDLDSLPF